MVTYDAREKNRPIGEVRDEPISLLGVLEAQNSELRNTVADLAIRTAILREQVAEIESVAVAAVTLHRRSVV